MGTFKFSSANRVEPLTISVKKVGDSRERFLTRNGNTVSFDEDTGDAIPYEITITDSATPPNVSKSTETLSCERPPDCQEGPELREIVDFDPTKITYKFHGVNVTQIERQIITNGLIVDSVIDVPSSPVVTSAFSGPLAKGTYILKLRGKSCYSEFTNGLEFTITDDATELDWAPGYPRFDYDSVAGKFRILIAVNRAGVWPIQIRNASDNSIIVIGNAILSPGQIETYAGFDEGNYDIDLATLSASLSLTAPPDECEQGPELLSVTSLSPTQTKFQFDGLSVFVIKWFIRNTSDVIEQEGTVEPGGALVTINHQPLSAGTHNLMIIGSSCTSQAGVVDNLDFTVAGSALSIQSVTAEQLPTGNYKLTALFSGGNPNFTITVRSNNNVTLGTFPNVTGSPASVTLPAGTAPQTVKLTVSDVNNTNDEETGIVLPAPTMKMSFLQAPNYATVFTKTPMPNDGSVFFIGSDPNYHWDIQVDLPNGGLWDYIEKRLRKKVSGVWVEKSISTATSQPQSYAVPATSGTESLFLPRNGNTVTIDGQNVFKTAAEWEFRAIARKGGVGGSIVSQLTRTFTVSAPPTLSGIVLYNANLDGSLGSAVGEINSVGSSYDKPKPRYDLAITDFGGVQFNQAQVFFRQKVGDSFVQRYQSAKTWGSLQTSVTPSDWSLFNGTNFANAHVSLLANEAQTWEIEFVALNGSTVVGNRKAIFNFTVGETAYVNPGFKTTTIGSRVYQQRQGLDFGSEILPSGNVRIFYPSQRQSINGQKTCYPWVYVNHVRMDPTELSALKSGSGLALVNGIYEFSVKYHSNAVANYDDVVDGGSLGSAYYLAGEQTEISYANSAMDDYFTVTIRPV